MADFFDSDIVRDEMQEINEMQEEIYGRIFQFPDLPVPEQIEHLNVNLTYHAE